MRMEYRSFEENSGRLNEHFLLGEIKKPPEYFDALKKLQKNNGYVPYEDSLKLARKFSPYDPTNPEKPFLNDLRIEFIDVAGMIKEDDMNRVKIFTAVGSPLDQWHGVDTFIEVENKNHIGSKIVKFDTKTDAKVESEIKRHNLHDLKADVLIYDIPDRETHAKKYYARLKEMAEEGLAALNAQEQKAA